MVEAGKGCVAVVYNHYVDGELFRHCVQAVAVGDGGCIIGKNSYGEEDPMVEITAENFVSSVLIDPVISDPPPVTRHWKRRRIC